jgi:hypothetical protein
MRYVHVKSGVKYRVLCEGMIEKTLTRCIIYENIETKMVWVRPYDEFHDGRFVLEQ